MTAIFLESVVHFSTQAEFMCERPNFHLLCGLCTSRLITNESIIFFICVDAKEVVRQGSIL